jgi:hypothetical protein
MIYVYNIFSIQDFEKKHGNYNKYPLSTDTLAFNSCNAKSYTHEIRWSN